LTGYTDSVNAVAFSPDGHTLASGSDDHTIRLWTLPSAIITGHTSTVYAVAFSPDGHTLVRQPEIEIFTVVSLFVAGSGWFWLGAGGVVAKSTSAGGVRGC
jgi:hypothetical protein